jgi:hypothetical protein
LAGGVITTARRKAAQHAANSELVAVGGTFVNGAFDLSTWTSTDGRTWLADPASVALTEKWSGSVQLEVSPGAKGILIAGSGCRITNGDLGGCNAFAFRSTGAHSWAKVTTLPAKPAWAQNVTVSGLTSVGGTWILTGQASADAFGNAPCAHFAWTSPDGWTWKSKMTKPVDESVVDESGWNTGTEITDSVRGTSFSPASRRCGNTTGQQGGRSRSCSACPVGIRRNSRCSPMGLMDCSASSDPRATTAISSFDPRMSSGTESHP